MGRPASWLEEDDSNVEASSEEDDSNVEDAVVDLSWLKNDPSVEDAKTFIENHPDALMGFGGDFIFTVVPLHEAIRRRAPAEVILLLLEACPQAAKKSRDCVLRLALDGDTICSDEVIKALLNAHPGAASERNLFTRNLPLHDAIKNKKISEGVIEALINAHPGAASAREPDTGNLPLHDAVNKKASEGIILLLLKAYPQAAAEKMKDGRLLFEICLERKASDDFVRAIYNVRINGLLPLGFVLTKTSSEFEYLNGNLGRDVHYFLLFVVDVVVIGSIAWGFLVLVDVLMFGLSVVVATIIFAARACYPTR